jgi:hypothetical protein
VGVEPPLTICKTNPARRRSLRVSCFIERLDLSGVKRDAIEAQIWQTREAFDQLAQGFARGNADAAESDIDFRQDTDFNTRRTSRLGQLLGYGHAVERHGNLGSFCNLH